MLKRFRILILLGVLLVVGVTEWRAQARAVAWNETLYVGIFPLNPDGSEAVAQYISRLEDRHFDGMETFFAEEMERYGIAHEQALDIRVGQPIAELPPELSAQPNVLEIISWSLRLRWWAWRNTPELALNPDIRLYVMYRDPQITERVAHSRGLQKGRLAVIHAFSGRDMHGTTSFVIAHELMHTLGATDKYDLGSGEPIWPEGYAMPDSDPVYPQKYAEIMGGRIPLSTTRSELPSSLWQAMVAERTAQEIGWYKP